jgi:hypothetical protein
VTGGAAHKELWRSRRFHRHAPEAGVAGDRGTQRNPRGQPANGQAPPATVSSIFPESASTTVTRALLSTGPRHLAPGQRSPLGRCSVGDPDATGRGDPRPRVYGRAHAHLELECSVGRARILASLRFLGAQFGSVNSGRRCIRFRSALAKCIGTNRIDSMGRRGLLVNCIRPRRQHMGCRSTAGPSDYGPSDLQFAGC